MPRLTTIPLAGISPDHRYRLSFPLQPEAYGVLARRIPGIPLLVTDRQQRIVSGHDFLAYLKKKDRKKVLALETDLAEKEALFFAFHWKYLISGFNLYEKLVFLKKALAVAPPGEIQGRAPLDIPLNGMLVENLDKLMLPPFKPLMMHGMISLRTLLHVIHAQRDDREVLAALLRRHLFNENQQQKIVEALEEIAFRDRRSWRQILADASLTELESRPMPQKAIIEALMQRRFPEFHHYYQEWQSRYQAPFAALGIQATPHPFFEKKEIDLVLRRLQPGQALKLLETLKIAAGG